MLYSPLLRFHEKYNFRETVKVENTCYFHVNILRINPLRICDTSEPYFIKLLQRPYKRIFIQLTFHTKHQGVLKKDGGV